MITLLPKNLQLNVLLILALFATSNTIFSQNTTNIIDPNFEQALIDLGIDTNGFNGTILNTDAAMVTALNVFEKNISSLEGIEAFENLTYLSAYNNNIATLNLSANLQLEIVDVESNNLQTLNISQNANIKELYVANNQLEVLEIGHLVGLELLSCSLNNLTQLNVSQNTNLEVLWCYNNALSTLDVTNNQLLQTLACGDNYLDNLNVSQNHSLHTLMAPNNNLNAIAFNNHSVISYLDISGNRFSELDLSENNSLVRLFIENNQISNLDLFHAPNLMLLFASGNQLENLDVSLNTALRFVRLANNNLQTLDIRNNSNQTISMFSTLGNTNLSCIMVDNVDADYLLNWTIDANSNFVQSSTACNALSLNPSEENKTNLVVYPNPASNVINIKNLEANARIALFNANGQLIKNNTTLMGSTQIMVSDLASGLYILQIKTVTGTQSQKIIIK
ncbi:T9SS type A sorting domain-containing protein [Bizionia sediminis]|uniref:T9SS type A sorting domain-containing protein n=1 Tax=Bizionia sediminis TaxID=1737064 RepID=A0ABW5KPT0_9FLAO